MPEGIPFPWFGKKLAAEDDSSTLVAGVEEVTEGIVGPMITKEYLSRRSEPGTMPRLNRAFEELGIHYENHKVPEKILASVTKKETKALARNVTAAAESKKRKSQPRLKVVSKK